MRVDTHCQNDMKLIGEAMAGFGPDRLFRDTGFPVVSVREGCAIASAWPRSAMPVAVRDAIIGGNAARLLCERISA